jgi:hypothetical protein
MPWGAAVDTNGLKSCVMLFSGELSMTSAGALLLLLPVPVDALEEAEVAPVEDGALELCELLDEQAASPAARRPAAVTANALLVISLLVNFDFPLG